MGLILQHNTIVKYEFTFLRGTELMLLLSTPTEWNLIAATLRTTISHPEAARSTFDLVVKIASEGQGQWVTPDNFTCLIAILDDFTSIAGASIPLQPQKSRRAQPQPSMEYAIDLSFTLVILIITLGRRLSTVVRRPSTLCSISRSLSHLSRRLPKCL